MARLVSSLKALLVLGLTLHLHHRVKGPPVDYAGLAAASAASWFGLPGPGEPVLIALGIFAAKHKLDITSVVVVAFLGAAAGGLAGWLLGLKAGRRLLTARGPLLTLRRNVLARGDAVFRRHPVLGILLTPSVVAGIHGVRPTIYNATNLLSAAVWAVGIGYGAYYVGPPIVDFVNDFGVAASVALGVLILVTLGAEFARRRRRGPRDAQAARPEGSEL
jgi:membrane protein DedA with SNARE-associated domain